MILALHLGIHFDPFVDQRFGFDVALLQMADVAQVDQRLRQRKAIAAVGAQLRDRFRGERIRLRNPM